MMGIWNKIVDGAKKVASTIKSAFRSAIEVGKKVVKATTIFVKNVVDISANAINKTAEKIKNFIQELKYVEIGRNGEGIFVFRIIWWNEKFEKAQRNSNVDESKLDQKQEYIAAQDGSNEKKALVELLNHVESISNQLENFKETQTLDFEDYARYNISRKFINDIKLKILNYPDSLNQADLTFLKLILNFIQGSITDSDLYLFEEEVQRKFKKSLAGFGIEQINYLWSNRYDKLKHKLEEVNEQIRLLNISINKLKIKREAYKSLSENEETQLKESIKKNDCYSKDLIELERQEVDLKKIISIIEGLLEIAEGNPEIPEFVTNKFGMVANILVKWEQEIFISEEEKMILAAFASQFWDNLKVRNQLMMEA